MSTTQPAKIFAALAASGFVHLAVFATVGTATAPALVDGSSGEIHFGSPPGRQANAKETEDTPAKKDEPVTDPMEPVVDQKVVEESPVDPPKIESPLPKQKPAVHEDVTPDRADTSIDPIHPVEEKRESQSAEDDIQFKEAVPQKDVRTNTLIDYSPNKTSDQPSETPEDTDGQQNSAQSAMTNTSQRESALPGNSDSSNYAGLVMRHLSKVRRPRAASPGSSFVSFTIGKDGELEDVRITQSSRSARFDRDALKVVRNAAPFPPPPKGVNRSFSVEIEGE